MHALYHYESHWVCEGGEFIERLNSQHLSSYVAIVLSSILPKEIQVFISVVNAVVICIRSF